MIRFFGRKDFHNLTLKLFCFFRIFQNLNNILKLTLVLVRVLKQLCQLYNDLHSKKYSLNFYVDFQTSGHFFKALL